MWYCGIVVAAKKQQHQLVQSFNISKEDWKKRVSEKQNRCFCISCGIARAHIGAVQLEDILFGWRHYGYHRHLTKFYVPSAHVLAIYGREQ